MLFFDTFFLIVLGVVFSFIFTLGVSAIVLNLVFNNLFPRIRKSIYLGDVNSVNKLIEALNE